MATISCREIAKRYGNQTVIENLSLEVADCEFVVFLGPSGCGKSTMLRMIAGLEEVSSGSIHIGGTDVTTLPPGDRGVAMVFQSYALYPHMSVRDNITFGLRRQHVPKQQIEERLAQATSTLGLTDYLDRRPASLSGGQQQRVAMARAMIKTPKVFLFDEPLSNLDAKLREKLRTEIRKLHLTLKTTTIFVTHDQLEAMTIADRIVLMREGHIEQKGTPSDIFERPATRFVADFIGTPTMNFIQATVKRENGRLYASCGSLRLLLPDHGYDGQPLPALDDGVTVELGLRPTRMNVAAPDALNVIAGCIVLIENMGSDAQIIVDVAGQELSFVTQSFASLKPGEKIHFAIQPEHIHLFDRTTGRSIRAATG